MKIRVLVVLLLCVGCNLSDNGVVVPSDKNNVDLGLNDLAQDMGNTGTDLASDRGDNVPDLPNSSDMSADADLSNDVDPSTDANLVDMPDLPPSPVCGDSDIEGTEVCDAENLDGKTCASEGFLGGFLACTSSCQLDTSSCRNTGRITGGNTYGCFLNSENSAKCWGSNAFGRATPPSGKYLTIDAGDRLVCAQKLNRTLECWGDLTDGFVEFPAGEFQKFAVADEHMCGILANGTLQCWGDSGSNLNAPMGVFKDIDTAEDFTCAINSIDEIECWGESQYGVLSPPSGVFEQISVGYDHACAMRADGSMICWGWMSESYPGPFRTFSSGYDRTCAIRRDNSVTCWVDGFNTPDDRNGERFLEIGVGRIHECGIKTDKTITCWGSSNSGENNPPPFD